MGATSSDSALAISIFAAQDLYYNVKPNAATAIFTLIGSQVRPHAQTASYTLLITALAHRLWPRGHDARVLYSVELCATDVGRAAPGGAQVSTRPVLDVVRSDVGRADVARVARRRGGDIRCVFLSCPANNCLFPLLRVI